MSSTTDFGSNRWRWTLTVAALLAVLAATASSASAHSDPEHGEITLHDEPDGEATTEVRCEFWVTGDGLSHPQGSLTLRHHKTGHTNQARLGDWEDEPDSQPPHRFEEGPFAYDGGDWGDHGVRAEMEGNHSTPVVWFDFTDCPQDEQHDQQDEQEEKPACPEDIHAEERLDGTIQLSWSASADAYKVLRAEDGHWETLAETNQTRYEDTETSISTTYQYRVLAVEDGVESEACPVIEASAIPVFGAPLFVGVSVVGSAGVLGLLYRRS